jgi:predicted transposase/invertase (TIGR01784 family)
MARYLDPKNDLTFKRIFGEHPVLLIDFLNALIPLPPERQIKEIEYLSHEQAPETPGKKNSFVDVKCKDKSGAIFIVEMQMLWTDNFMKRILFNAGKAVIKQLDKGNNFQLLQPVYTLAILDENYDRQTTQCYHHYNIVNIENSDEIIKGLEFVFVELPKFQADTWSKRKTASLWLRFLKEVNESMTQLPPELAANEHIRHAAELCEQAAFTPEELAAYEEYWDIIRKEKSDRIEWRQEGHAAGLVEGEAIGLEKGEAIGEVKNQIQSVLNGHHAGYEPDVISIFTGLSIEQIKEILKKHGLI